MPHKLGFHVTQASSEDDGGRAKELLQQGPGVKGWASARFCIYPQELVFQLEERCNLSRVQLLAHQHLIPEKIELYIGDVPPGREVALYNVRFAQLGYITLSDNEHSQFKARELKSVTVDCTGTFLKLVLHKNHINRLNLYNQIGLVAINILGNEVETNNNSVSPDGEGGQVPSARDQEVPIYHDLAFAMYVDTQVAATIRTLEDRRLAAMREQRYEYANKLKSAVTQLRAAGERLGKYELEKRHAIENENFDRAKLKKQLADEYREQVYKALEIEDLLERKGKLDRNDAPAPKGLRELPPPPRVKNKPRSRDPSPTLASAHPAHTATTHLPPARPTNTPPKPPPSPPKSPSPPPIKTPSAPLPDLRQPHPQANTPRLGTSQLPPPPAAPSPAPYTAPPTSYADYDEQTLPALKHRDVLDRATEESDVGTNRRSHGLTEADKKDAALPIDVFGRELVEKIYSKNYSDKENGLKQLQREMTAYSPDGSGVRPDRFVRASVVLVRKALKDKVYSVALLASQTLSLLLSDFFSKHKVTKKEMTSTLEKVLPDLLAKTSDNATRTQNLATTAVLEVLSLSLERGLGGVGVEVTRPLTNTVHPRGALCRANIVETQLNTLGPTALPKDKESGFTPRHVVEFGHSAFKHQNNEVRKVGERLLLALYPHFPSTVRKALPLQDDLARKNVLYRNLFEQLEALDEKTPPRWAGRPASAGSSAPRRPRQSHRQPMPSKREAAAVSSSSSSARVRPSPSQSHAPPHSGASAGASSSSTPNHTRRIWLMFTPSSSSGVSTGSSASSVGSTGYPPVPQISITPDEAEVRGRALSRLNRSRSDLRVMEDEPSPGDSEDKTCIFCGAYDESFSDNGLDMHYWRACPMLTRCHYCRQVVEVASLTQHLLGECVASTQYRRCDRCSEAIPKKVFYDHAASKSCTPCKPEPIANHCPLCHENIPPWDEGWRVHLMPGPDCCPANTRARPHASKKQTPSDKSPSVSPAGASGSDEGAAAVGGASATGGRSRIPSSSTPGTPRKDTLKRRR
ncbi:centrosomal protein of 104 kDa isoform X3 [Penaeus vannamei]|uniref:centrosomal protein of 104 kDa isoform X3 n=1 Tax=Penaeus vannamei TaxID=6689 RepID=UPI00387F4EEA